MNFLEKIKNPVQKIEIRKSDTVKEPEKHNELQEVENTLPENNSEGEDIEEQATKTDLGKFEERPLLKKMAEKGILRTDIPSYLFEDELTFSPKKGPISEIQFKTVLLNFLSNAYKYTDSGTIKIKTRIFNKNREKKQKLRIMVEDSGTGFKGINIEMNKPYHYHDKGKKNKEGSGFGLYMVTEILRAVNSQIKYQTSEIGSMFYFDLIEASPYNEIIDLTKMYSNYLRQLIDDINAGKKDNVNIIGNPDNKITEEDLKKVKSPQINGKHNYIIYPHNNAIENLLGTDKKLSIIK
ncbi:MAG: ATP-binding protein, partial [Alphaproteobacteria bacterium]|nr:ATP-binding protein [Alphaproteobacteria bacterium]